MPLHPGRRARLADLALRVAGDMSGILRVLAMEVSGGLPDLDSNRPRSRAHRRPARHGRERAGYCPARRATMGGPGAFVMPAASRLDLARALRAKLVREIA